MMNPSNQAQTMNQTQQAGLLQQSPPTEDLQAGETAATPEEQQQYDTAIRAALGGIAENSDAFNSLVEAIKTAGTNPIQQFARLTLTLLDKAEQKTGPIENEDVMENVVESIIEKLVELAIDAGAIQQQQATGDFLADIFAHFMSLWAKAHPERLDDEDRALLGQMEQQARQQGIQQG